MLCQADLRCKYYTSYNDTKYYGYYSARLRMLQEFCIVTMGRIGREGVTFSLLPHSFHLPPFSLFTLFFPRHLPVHASIAPTLPFHFIPFSLFLYPPPPPPMVPAPTNPLLPLNPLPHAFPTPSLSQCAHFNPTTFSFCTLKNS